MLLYFNIITYLFDFYTIKKYIIITNNFFFVSIF